MIKFKTTPEAVWVAGDHPAFDESEIGHFEKKQRAKLAFLISPMTPKLVSEVNDANLKRETKTTFQGGRRQTEIKEEPDKEKANDDLIDRIVGDWRGIVGENDKEMQCTRENKLSLINNGYPGLGVAWVTIAREIMSRFDELKESESKNFESSQNGSKGDKAI